MAGRSKNAGRRFLTLKHNRWWFRRDIPVALRGAVGRGTCWQVNLETSDLSTAQRLRDELEKETAEVFAAVRDGKPIANAAERSAREQGIIHREAVAAAALIDNGEPDETGPLAIAITSAESTADGFRRAEDREAFMDALHGYEPVDTHIDAFLATAKLAPKTISGRRGRIGQFAKWAAGQKPPLTLDRVDRRQAGRYVTEVIDQMHRSTQATHLTALRSYWTYLAARGLVDTPLGTSPRSGWPWNDQQLEERGTRAERGSKAQKERPFTDDEVRTLLYSPYPPRQRRAFESQIRDATLISLLSGMRLAEIVTLWVEEVRELPDGGGLVFDIQQGKTEAAARPVPIHPDLVAIVRHRMKHDNGNPKDGKEWLFHELADERDPGDVFGKRFARFRQRLGVDDQREGVRRSLVNFHSARRWFITQARHADQPRETIADVVGHAPDKKDVTFGTYARSASPAQMRACVEAVQLPEPQAADTVGKATEAA